MQLEYYTDIKYTAIDLDIQTVLLDKDDGASLQIWRIGWQKKRILSVKHLATLKFQAHKNVLG